MLYIVIQDINSVTPPKITTLARSKKPQKVFKKGEQSKTLYPSGICCAPIQFKLYFLHLYSCDCLLFVFAIFQYFSHEVVLLSTLLLVDHVHKSDGNVFIYSSRLLEGF